MDAGTIQYVYFYKLLLKNHVLTKDEARLKGERVPRQKLQVNGERQRARVAVAVWSQTDKEEAGLIEPYTASSAWEYRHSLHTLGSIQDQLLNALEFIQPAKR